MDAGFFRNRQRRLGLLVVGLALGVGAGFAGWRALQRKHGPGPVLGEVVADFTLPDLDGRSVTLSRLLRGRAALAIVFTGIDCPVGNLYLPRLATLEARFRAQGVAFLAVNSNAHESLAQIRQHATEHGIAFPVVKDWNNKLADALRIERVGEVLVLDAGGRLRYRGAVDDQYARGAFKPEPTRFYLAQALESVLRGRPVETPVSSVVTCPIDRVIPERARRSLRRPGPEFAKLRKRASPPDLNVGAVDFARHVAPIVREKCQLCHRPGEVAPFSLLGYDDARRWAESIYEVVDQGLMPPWHADPRYGRFTNDRSLTDRERATMLAWVEQGTPAGDLALAPPPAESRLGWTMGTPDVVFEMAESVDVPPEGQLPIRKFIVPTGFTHDVWVSAAQALPGDRSVVHHICVFVIDPKLEQSGSGDREQRRRERPELVCYAPGDRPSVFPEGTAKLIPAGALLEMQVHYQPVGVARFDRSAIGLRVARGPITKLALSRSASNRDFVLAPGAAHVELRASYTLLQSGQLLSMTPHMHFRGRSMRYEAAYPDGTRETLLSVPCYDFNWQNVYRLAEPKPLPQGTRIECIALFDNSAGNPVNPDPTKEVRWGEQSTDEMMIGYFDYCVDLSPPRMAGTEGLPRR